MLVVSLYYYHTSISRCFTFPPNPSIAQGIKISIKEEEDEEEEDVDDKVNW